MLKHITNAKILTPHGWVENGTISFSEGRIISIKDSSIVACDKNVTDAKGAYIIPGGIDLHVHGGGGHDFMECSEEAFRVAIKTHLKHGTTAIYPTLGAASHDSMMQAIGITERLMAEPNSTIMGLHIEGPYLNPKMAGGQIPEYICNPAAEQYTEMLNSTDCIKRWDAAPELEGSMEFAQYATSKGVKVAIAHTTADYNTNYHGNRSQKPVSFLQSIIHCSLPPFFRLLTISHTNAVMLRRCYALAYESTLTLFYRKSNLLFEKNLFFL